MSAIKAEVIKMVRDLCIKNKKVPYITVLYTEEINMLESMVVEGKIILNISNNAILNIFIDSENISFQMGVNKVPLHVVIPLKLIASIYPRESVNSLNKDNLDKLSDIIYFPVMLVDKSNTTFKSLESSVKKNIQLKVVK